VLDWELSTIGHPLADFSYHCMSWHIPQGPFRGIGGSTTGARHSDRRRIRAALLRTHRPARPDAVMADWNFYLAYNLFRIAGILQGIAKRVETGTASSAQARQSAAGARRSPRWAGDGTAGLSDARPHRFTTGETHGFQLLGPHQGTAGATARFMDDHIYPAEARYRGEIEANTKAASAGLR
jgi:hypothetical protein